MKLLLPLILLSGILQCYAQGKDDPSDSKLSQSFAWTEKQLKTNQIKKKNTTQLVISSEPDPPGIFITSDFACVLFFV